VRALVCTLPTLLPSLFLVSKHYHTALALVHPNAPLWQAYFQSSPGYSDYRADAEKGVTWKDLLTKRSLIARTFYAVSQVPYFKCGIIARERNDTWHPIDRIRCPIDERCTGKHRWVEEKVKLERDPWPSQWRNRNVVRLRCRGLGGIRWSNYLWDPLTDKIWYRYFNGRKRLALARKGDPCHKKCRERISRFVGII
jgi:hypothetical protein